MESNGIVIRKVDKADFQKLVKLYEEVWSDVPYDKENKANFVLNESEGINYCADLNGEVVGSRTSFYMYFYYGEREIKCLQVGDSCTRKDCRGKGIFYQMNQSLLHSFFKESEGELIWNISVDASRRVYERLGWVYINSLATLIKVCRPLHILSILGLRVSSLHETVNWNQDNTIIEIDEPLLCEREKQMNVRKFLHVKYDKDVIIWRLKSQSGIKAYSDKDNGTILYKIGSNKGLTFVLIGEVFAKKYDFRTINKLIKGLRKETGADIIKTAVSLGHPILKYYRQLGFIFNPMNKFLNHGVRVETEEMKEICYTPQNWAISMLDVDTF